jgi:hypothetical protein
MKYLIGVSLVFFLVLGLSFSRTEQSSIFSASSVECPYPVDRAGGSDNSTTGCPYLDGKSECPCRESAASSPAQCPYLGQGSESSVCPYLNKRSDDSRGVRTSVAEKNV